MGLVVLMSMLLKVQFFWNVTLSVGDYVLCVSFSGLRSPKLLNPEDEEECDISNRRAVLAQRQKTGIFICK